MRGYTSASRMSCDPRPRVPREKVARTATSVSSTPLPRWGDPPTIPVPAPFSCNQVRQRAVVALELEDVLVGYWGAGEHHRVEATR